MVEPTAGATPKLPTPRLYTMLQFSNDNADARVRRIGSRGWMTLKVTRNECLFRFRQGGRIDDDDDDSVDAVDIDRVLGFVLVVVAVVGTTITVAK